jgi:hypothetical protein
VSKDYVGLAVNFTPTWFQVLPGVDMQMPLTWSQGLSGNAAVQLGGNKNTGTFSAGIAADIYQKHRVTLAYNGYFGDYSLTARRRHERRQRHQRRALRSRLDLAHLQDHFLRIP